MPNCILAETENFIIEWWPGKTDGRGLYITNRSEHWTSRDWLSEAAEAAPSDRDASQCFVERALVPDLIHELRSNLGATTLLSRVATPGFIPGFFRVPKKDGGNPTKAYYTPLRLQDEQRGELANALEFACSKENVNRLEAANTDEYYSVLDNDYLENGLWASARYSVGLASTPTAHLLPPATLEQAPKARLLAPSHRGQSYGAGFSLLRVANTQHRCRRGSDPATRKTESCLRYVWIKPGEYYLEHKQGSDTQRYHLACAFRSGKIPVNWLNPHFEQYHVLVAQNFKGWIEAERTRRDDYDENDFQIPSNEERVRAFVEQVQGGYTLNSYEREDWRDHLRHVPVDIELYRTARRLVGLEEPAS